MECWINFVHRLLLLTKPTLKVDYRYFFPFVELFANLFLTLHRDLFQNESREIRTKVLYLNKKKWFAAYSFLFNFFFHFYNHSACVTNKRLFCISLWCMISLARYREFCIKEKKKYNKRMSRLATTVPLNGSCVRVICSRRINYVCRL